MIWPHLLLHSARIALCNTVLDRFDKRKADAEYRMTEHEDEVYERRLKSARDAVGILREIQHYDANYHEVAIAVSCFLFL